MLVKGYTESWSARIAPPARIIEPNGYPAFCSPGGKEDTLASRGSALVSGSLAGLAGLVVFLVIHAVWIVPIWSVAPLGALVAAVGGVAVGRAYEEHRRLIPGGGLGRVTAVSLAGALVLLPAEPIALVFAPSDSRLLFSNSIGQDAATLLVVGFVVFIALAAVIGAALGAWLGRSAGSAAITGLAAVAFAIGVGHNAPFLGASPVAIKMWVIMLAATVAAAVVLVVADWLLRRGDREPGGTMPI